MHCAVRFRESRLTWLLRALAITAALLPATDVRAIDALNIDLDSVPGAGWSAHGIAVQFSLRSQQLEVRIDEVRVTQLTGPLRAIHVQCPTVQITSTTIDCAAAQVTASVPGLGLQRFVAEVSYGRRDESIVVQAHGLKIGEAEMSLRVASGQEDWDIAASLQSVPLNALAELATSLDIAVPIDISSGAITAQLSATGAEDQVRTAAVRGQLHSLTLNNESGSLASDALALAFDMKLEHRTQQWSYELEMSANSGQAYAEPIFLDFAAHPLQLKSSGTREATGEVRLTRFDVDHAAVLQAHGTALLDPKQQQPIRELSFTLQALQFPGAYDAYLQPLLLETSFKSLQTAGRIAGSLTITEGTPSGIELNFDGVHLDAGETSIAVNGLDGRWLWTAQDADEREPQLISHLAWSGGSLFKIPFGASSMRFATEARSFRLLEATRIPLLDGALQLDSLRARNVGLPSIAFMIDASLEPLSVQQLARAFDWPEFGGQLSGSISKLRMRDGVLTLGTTLEAQVFGGAVRVSDLRLEQPFGKWPRFYSNVELSDLDLDLVTSAFSFGRITGRLSGSILGLELFAWAPIAFDAKLRTPPNDRSRHRISQRAVENIGSIGGGGAGVTAALSSGFLRFFEDFNYAQLGISCRLRNEVCEMSGVGPAPNGGYYLVQGRGLPRIDVIGNSRRVDWPRLVRQLIAVTESEGPVVR
jgi:hypothetical protein